MSRILGFPLLVWTLSVGLSTGASLPDNVRPVVDIPGKGRVIGVEEKFNGFTYFAFKAIPYAQPPIGELRFKDPVESEGWEGDLDGAKLPAVCTQNFIVKRGEEDCLFLSVYTPHDAFETDKDPLAVMVYIHGGYLLFGSMEDSDKCHTIIEKDVIMVNLQYRLGVLGFLSTEDSAAPGNLGLKDQTLALKWIKENIASFGGDPNKITIFGESAGSYSVSYQMLVPSAAGLFHGAIMQSGNALCPGAHGRNFLLNSRAIAIDFGCPVSTSDKLVSCLQQQPAMNLTEKNHKFDQWHNHPRIFAPRVDGFYIPDEPLTLLKEKRYSHVPVIMGMTRDEGALYSVDWYANASTIPSLLEHFEKNGPISLELLPEEDPLNTTYKVYENYLPGLVIGEEQADNATLMNGHRFIQIPTDWAVDMMATQVPVFMYELHHRGQYGLMDSYIHLHPHPVPQAAKWVCHSDDLQYLFDHYLEPLERKDDLAVREIFANTWTNFAKTLDPTPDESLGYKWDKIGTTGLRHFTILPDPVMEDDSRLTDRQLWNSLPLNENPYRKFVH